MTTKQRPTDPTEQMGIFKTLADVPDRYRLKQHAAAYDGRDVWEQYLSEDLFNRVTGERGREDARRAGQRWKDHMAERGRHHALAMPEDVDEWADMLNAQYSPRQSAYYWTKIEQFYGWLQYHTEHPHVYNPVLMAAVGQSPAHTVWEHKIDHNYPERDQ